MVSTYLNKKKYRKFYLFIFTIITIIFGLFSITVGPLDISIKEVFSVISYNFFPDFVSKPTGLVFRTIWFIRIPRVLTAFVVGGCLAISGAVMQPTLRNPMGSPFTLGISSGAGFGAALAIICGKSIGRGSFYIIANAFLFALLTASIIVFLSRKKGAKPEIMILIGISLSHLFSAGTTVMQYFADSWATAEVVFWLVGSLSKGTWTTLKYITPVAFVCIPFLIIRSRDLNIMNTGDDSAKSLGVDVHRVRVEFMVVSSLLTATVICFTGSIGFIGLLAPHITRLIGGGDNRFVVPASGLIGAFILAVADLFAMNIISPVIIPIGIMTSFVGVPLLIYLVVRNKKGLAL